MIPILICLGLSAQMTLSFSIRPSEAQLSAFSRTIDMIFADSFDQAYRLTAQFPDTIPGRPVYHLICGSVVHAEIFDSEDYGKEKIFLAHIDSSINLLSRWVDDNPDDAWGFFFLGTAYGYKSLLYAQKQSWFKSLVSGLKSKGRFNDAIKLDPTLYDVYTGLGSYYYWSTVKLRKYIPFLPDNREKGLTALQIAIDSSLFSGKPAEVGLAWALIEENKLTKAARIGLKLHKETRGGRNSLWILGGAYWRMGNLAMAAEYYRDLVDSYLRAGNQNYFNLILCRYRRGICLYGLGKMAEARREFETLLSYNASGEIRKRHKNTYEKTREYLKKIEKGASKP